MTKQSVKNWGGGNFTGYFGPSPGFYSKWSGSSAMANDSYFPLGVWLQFPLRSPVISPYADSAEGYAALGINLSIGVTDAWGADFTAITDRWREVGIQLITGGDLTDWVSNGYTLHGVVGTNLDDEPDARSSNPGADNLKPTPIYNAAQTFRFNNRNYPVHINFGKPITGYGFYVPTGGVEVNYCKDMQKYQRACDLTSYDWYPWTNPFESVLGGYKYGLYTDGMRAHALAAGQTDKPMWTFIELDDPWTSGQDVDGSRRITPDQMEQAVWNSIVHGARGILYFVHRFNDIGDPGSENSILDPNLTQGVTGPMRTKLQALNQRISGLAPVLNSPEIGTYPAITDPNDYDPIVGREGFSAFIAVVSTNGIPVEMLLRRYNGQWYLFAQASGDDAHTASGNTTATFTWVAGGPKTVTVRDESRTLSMNSGGVFTDTFTAYQTHIYVWS